MSAFLSYANNQAKPKKTGSFILWSDKNKFLWFFHFFIKGEEKTIGKIPFFSWKYTLPETNLCVPSFCFSGATAQPVNCVN